LSKDNFHLKKLKDLLMYVRFCVLRRLNLHCYL